MYDPFLEVPEDAFLKYCQTYSSLKNNGEGEVREMCDDPKVREGIKTEGARMRTEMVGESGLKNVLEHVKRRIERNMGVGGNKGGEEGGEGGEGYFKYLENSDEVTGEFVKYAREEFRSMIELEVCGGTPYLRHGR